MTDVNKRLADILAEYTATMNDLERPSATRPDRWARPDRRVLKPADRQRACTAPTISGESPTSRC
jgi:hypothetical protein